MNNFMGIPVHQSAHAVTMRSKRTHAEKSWMKGRCYHKRIQKKWDKRFGKEAQPAVFVFDPRALRLEFSVGGSLFPQGMIVAHPSAVAAVVEGS